MKAVSFDKIDGTAIDRRSYGILDDGIFEASAEFRAEYADLRAVIAAGQLSDLADNLDSEPVEKAFLLPPIPNPQRIICVGVNYRLHADEMGRELPEHPLLFVRFPSGIVGHEDDLLAPAVSEKYDFEGEIAIVIGTPARYVGRDFADQVIAGYTAFMDGSVRDWQRHTSQFIPGKNFDKSGAMGPCLVTPDEMPADPRLTTRLNGRTMQTGRLSELLFPVGQLIEYCSTFTELAPGDVIATGTPEGVGAARKPPVWLKPGDELEITVEGIPPLRNTVAAE